jgi:glutamate synthase (ferredoxin)
MQCTSVLTLTLVGVGALLPNVRVSRPALRSHASSASRLHMDAVEDKWSNVARADIGELGTPCPGPFTLVGERDACGVGFIADRKGRRREDILPRALRGLGCMEHRGACGGDRVSGDGAGINSAVPWELFEAEGILEGRSVDKCGVAMMFLPQEESDALVAQELLEAQAARNGLELIAWREVPQDRDVLGILAREALPTIKQAFFYHPDKTGDALEDAIYSARRSAQAECAERFKPTHCTTLCSFTSLQGSDVQA